MEKGDHVRTPLFLIVDNDAMTCQALRTLLELRFGDCAVTCVHNGASALEKSAEADYDVVITDIEMPEMDGLVLMAALQQQRNVPIIVISGNDRSLKRALDQGAFAILPKPLERGQFIEVVRQAMKTRTGDQHQKPGHLKSDDLRC